MKKKLTSEFRQLFVHIEKAVKARYPENVRTTIGGFIFLRFFCPAVSSPEAYGILDGNQTVFLIQLFNRFTSFFSFFFF